MRKFLKIILIILISSFLVACGGIFFLFSSAKSQLPDIKGLIENYAAPEPTSIYDINGELIDKIYIEDREAVPFDKIPQDLKDAFLSIEDKRFYEHNGIDYIRLTKSVFVNIITMRKAQGGSTITQQLARNAFLTLEKKWDRKIKEAIIAMEIERLYTKDEIFEKYINEINYGQGSYGAQVAAKTYFGKDLLSINLAEAAMLAGIPNRPGAYNPMKSLEAAQKRQKLVLAMMLKNGFINQTEYDIAMSQSFVYEDEATNKQLKDAMVTIVKRSKIAKRGNNAPEFIDLVKSELLEEFEEEELYQSGYKVYTTIDIKMQKEAEKALKESVPFQNDPNLNGALITIDANNGYIKAMVGGRDAKAGDFNRTTQAKRQPGSAFKPFVYFTALEKGYEMSSMIEDKPVTYGNWSPRNYGNKYSNMPVSLLQALDKSLNSVTVQLMNAVGPDAVIDRAKKAGFTSDIPRELSISLGTMSVSPLELARAYAPFANGGYKIKPISIIKVTDRFDKVIYEAKEEKEKVFNTQNVALINHMLQSVVNNGTGRAARVFSGNRQVAVGGKTGTTNESRSAWFAGFTPDTVTTIYIGYDDNKPIKGAATGGGSVAPIFGKYYNSIVAKGIYKPTYSFPFVANVGVSDDLISENIDPLTGLPIDGEGGTEAMIRRENMPAEYSNKYEEGLEGFFNEDTSSTNTSPTNTNPTNTPNTNKQTPKPANGSKDDKRKSDIDSTLDEIFSN